MQHKPFQVIAYLGYRIELHNDEDAESPREWDNDGTMVCWHRRSNLGDENLGGPEYVEEWLCRKAQEYCPFFPDEGDTRKAIAIIERNNVILPLYLYEHSGMTMNTTGFSCPWDSGQVGFILMPKKEARKEWPAKTAKESYEKARKCLESEVKTYDDYLTGNVGEYLIYKENPDLGDADDEDADYSDEEVLDSMSDSYPDEWPNEWDHLIAEAKAVIDGYVAKEPALA